MVAEIETADRGEHNADHSDAEPDDDSPTAVPSGHDQVGEHQYEIGRAENVPRRKRERVVGAEQHQLDGWSAAGDEWRQNLSQNDAGQHGNGQQERPPDVLSGEGPNHGEHEHDDRQRHRPENDGQADHQYRQGRRPVVYEPLTNRRIVERRPVRLQHVDDQTGEQNDSDAHERDRHQAQLPPPGFRQGSGVDDELLISGAPRRCGPDTTHVCVLSIVQKNVVSAGPHARRVAAGVHRRVLRPAAPRLQLQCPRRAAGLRWCRSTSALPGRCG